MYVRGAPFKEDWSIGKSQRDQSHEHQPWIDSANFLTSDEAAYPLNFCRPIALPLSVEGVSQMVYILPERLLTLVRPAFDLVLRRI